MGCANAPTTRLRWRKKRTRSRPARTRMVARSSRHRDGVGRVETRVRLGIRSDAWGVIAQGMSCQFEEDVRQRGPAQVDGDNFPWREGLDDPRNQQMAIPSLHLETSIHDDRRKVQACAKQLRGLVEIRGLHGDDVAYNF